MSDRLWGEQDKVLLRRWEAERNELIGPTALYYSVVRGAHVDPLYQEPVADPLYGGPPTGTGARHTDAFEYAGPYSVIVAVLFERSSGRTVQADETGVEAMYDGEVYVARDEWEGKVTTGALPKEADVLFVNNEWWDVIAANSGGHVTDSGHHVGWKLQVKKRDRFEPNRKV